MVEVRLRYVFRVIDKKGRAHHYFRAKGTTYALHGKVGSAAFFKSYNNLLSAHFAGTLAGRPKPRRRRPIEPQSALSGREWRPGSIGWFVTEYLMSPEYANFASGTQRLYRRELDDLRRRIGPIQILRLDHDAVDAYSAIVARERTATAADQHVRLISTLWKFSRSFPECKKKGRTNPTVEAVRRHRTATPHEPWPEDVQKRFLEAATHPLRLAFYLLLYTGQRRSDIVDLKWTNYVGDKLHLIQQKTGEKMVIHVHKRLQQALHRATRTCEYILAHKNGRPYSSDGLSNAVKRTLCKIGAKNHTLHGLRKTAAVALAEIGRSEFEIMAVLGHRTSKMASYYCRGANRIKLSEAAISAWEQAIGPDTY